MLRCLAGIVALSSNKPGLLRQLSSEVTTGQLQSVAGQANLWVQQYCAFSSSSTFQSLQQPPQQIQQLRQCRSQLTLAAAAAAVQQSWPSAAQQWQQKRTLLGVVKRRNYQDHNKKKPAKYKMKTPSIVKRRVVMTDDGTMWRMQAGRRHKRYKKNRLRLLDLKGMVPLHSAHAAKLRKLGFHRKWWHTLKA